MGCGGRTEVVVALKRPSLAVAMGLRARQSPTYLRELEAGLAANLFTDEVSAALLHHVPGLD